jgi:hypothetical protein
MLIGQAPSHGQRSLLLGMRDHNNCHRVINVRGELTIIQSLGERAALTNGHWSKFADDVC